MTIHEGCDRAGVYQQADFTHEGGSPKCLVKIGCRGPVVNCNVTKRGWMNGIRGCPNGGGICIARTMPGFPDKFMSFMDGPLGASIAGTAIKAYGKMIRTLQGVKNRTANEEPESESARSTATFSEVVLSELQRRVGRIDDLVSRIDAEASEEVRDHVRELVDVLLEVHGSALESLLESLHSLGGQSAIDDASGGELVGSLLLLHGLHPRRREARVTRALEGVRPYVQSHGCDVELMRLTEEGKLSVRLQGSRNGCPSSSATLKYAIEEAIYKAAPDIIDIEIVDAEEIGTYESNGHAPLGDTFIPIAALKSKVERDDSPFPDP